MSTRNLAMVEMLLSRNRYAEAEEMLRQALAEDPQDAYALSLLAITLSEQRRFGDAMQSAQRAIGRGGKKVCPVLVSRDPIRRCSLR